jgi:hypothetical protein
MTTNNTPMSLFAQLAKCGAREIVTFGGVKIEVVEMSFAERSALAKIHSAGGDAEEIGEAFIRAILRTCCYAPGTKDKVFGDGADISQLPMGLVLQLAEHAKRINGLSGKKELEPDPDAEEPIHEPSEAEKNG